MPNTFSTNYILYISEPTWAYTSAGAQQLCKALKYIHPKFQILTQRNKRSHIVMMMSYDVTGGGPVEAPTVDLSVPVLKLIHYYDAGGYVALVASSLVHNIMLEVT